MRNSIKAAAPLVVLLGCYFHFSQVQCSTKCLALNYPNAAPPADNPKGQEGRTGLGLRRTKNEQQIPQHITVKKQKLLFVCEILTSCRRVCSLPFVPTWLMAMAMALFLARVTELATENYDLWQFCVRLLNYVNRVWMDRIYTLMLLTSLHLTAPHCTLQLLTAHKITAAEEEKNLYLN